MSAPTSPELRADPIPLGPRIRRGLDRTRRRARVVLAARGLASLALVLVLLSLVSFALDRPLRLAWTTRAVLLLLGTTAAAAAAWTRLVLPLRTRLPDDELARLVEGQNPALDWRLLSAVQFASGSAARERSAERAAAVLDDDPAATWRPGPGASRQLAALIAQDADALAAAVDFGAVVPAAPAARAALRGTVVAAAGVLLVLAFPTPARTWFRRDVLLSSTERWPVDTSLGLTDVRSKGKDLLDGLPRDPTGGAVGVPEGGLALQVTLGGDLTIAVLATGVVPSRVYLDMTDEAGADESLVLDALGDGRFRASLDEVPQGFTATLRGGDGEAGPLRVSVVRQPWIDSLGLNVVPPPHTGLAAQTMGVEAGTLTLPVGTRVRLEARVSKPLASARLEERPTGVGAADVASVHTTTFSEDRKALVGEWVLERSGAFALDVVDDDRLGLTSPVRFALIAQPDHPPEVELRLKGVGLNVTTRAHLRGETSATDDHGLVSGRLRLEATGGGEAPKKSATVDLPALVQGAPGTPPRPAREGRCPAVLELEPLAVVPGQALAVWAEATDGDPRGPNVGASTPIQLRVVTPDALLNDLLRRLHEQRLELERMIVEEERLAQGLTGLDKTTLERAPRTHKDVARTVSRAADVVAGIVDEMVTNDVLDQATWTRLRDEVAAPLHDLPQGSLGHAREAAEKAGQAAEAERDALTREAGAGAGRVVADLQAIVARMGRIEELAELVAILKRIIERERELGDRTRREGRPH